MTPLAPASDPAVPTCDGGRSGSGPAARRRPTRFALGRAARTENDRLAWVDAVEERVVEAGVAGGLDPDASFFLGVAVREALVNAIRHGAAADGGSRVTATLGTTRRGALAVTVRDHGRGFDPCALPDPLGRDNLCRNCGRGIFYMRRFADRVAFWFPRTGGTVVRIEKALPALSAAPSPRKGRRSGESSCTHRLRRRA